MLSDTSLAQPASQELLWKIRCIGSKKEMVVENFTRKLCDGCKVKRYNAYLLNRKKKRFHIKACVECNYIFECNYKTRKYCCNRCKIRNYMRRKK